MTRRRRDPRAETLALTTATQSQRSFASSSSRPTTTSRPTSSGGFGVGGGRVPLSFSSGVFDFATSGWPRASCRAT